MQMTYSWMVNAMSAMRKVKMQPTYKGAKKAQYSTEDFKKLYIERLVAAKLA